MLVDLSHNNNTEIKTQLYGGNLRYFALAMPTSLTSSCNLCKRNCVVVRDGGRTEKYNTINLIKQLQKPHAKEQADFKKKK